VGRLGSVECSSCSSSVKARLRDVFLFTTTFGSDSFCKCCRMRSIFDMAFAH